MNKSECGIKTQLQACHFSLFFELSSFSSFIASHVFDGIRTQLSYHASFLLPESETYGAVIITVHENDYKCLLFYKVCCFTTSSFHFCQKLP